MASMDILDGYHPSRGPRNSDHQYHLMARRRSWLFAFLVRERINIIRDHCANFDSLRRHLEAHERPPGHSAVRGDGNIIQTPGPSFVVAPHETPALTLKCAASSHRRPRSGHIIWRTLRSIIRTQGRSPDQFTN